MNTFDTAARPCAGAAIRLARAALALAAAAILAISASAEEPAPATYTAVYEAFYRGRNVGSSRFSVSYDAARDVYEFRSYTEAEGLLARLLVPRPIVERSEFRYEDGHIVPLRYVYEDGTRGGGDDLRTEFDWDAGTAAVTSDDGTSEMPISRGVLDRATLQVALMRDLEAGGPADRYRLADEDGVKTYRYTERGRETVAAGIGEIETRVLVQQRAGSSRRTWLWVAPALRHLPVRIEQRRDGETRSAFVLERVEGLR